MQKNEYLEMYFWPTEEFTILTDEKHIEFLKSQLGSKNQIHAIDDLKGKEAFGQNACIVNISFMNKFVYEPEETTKPFEMTTGLQTRLGMLRSNGYGISRNNDDLAKSQVTKNDKSFTFVEISNMTTEDFEKLIVSEEFTVCMKYNQTGEYCGEQCKLCEQAETNGVTVDEQKKINEEKNKAEENPQQIDLTKQILDDRISQFQNIGFTIEGDDLAYEELDIPIKTIEEMGPEEFRFSLEHYTNEVAKIVEKGLSENASENVSIEDVEFEEVNEIQEEDLEAASEKFDEMVDSFDDDIEEEADEEADEEEQDYQDALEQDSQRYEDAKKDVSMKAKETIPTSLFNSPESENKQEFVVSSGFFTTLARFGFKQLNLTLTLLDNGDLAVNVRPENFSGDSAYDEIKPMTVTGNPKDLDQEFFGVISRPLKMTHDKMSVAEKYIKELEKQEKETKAKKAIKDRADKAIKKAEEYQKSDKFKTTDNNAVQTAVKNWNDVLAIDSDNSKAKKAIADLSQYQQQTLL